MITETPRPRPATSSTSPAADTQAAIASVLPFRRRRREQADTRGSTVQDMPPISCSVHVDLTTGTNQERRYAAWGLSALPDSTTVHVRVAEGWTGPVMHALAQAVAQRRLCLRLEGTPDALRAWYHPLRDLISSELRVLEEARS